MKAQDKPIGFEHIITTAQFNTLPAEEIHQRIFTANADLPDGVERIPIKTVHLNKCPVLAPISVLKPQDQERLQLDLAQCYNNINKIKSAVGLTEKIQDVFSKNDFAQSEPDDPDLAIYSGGFFSDADKQKLAKIRSMQPTELAAFQPKFNDKRLPEMLFRYRARNFPETLSKEESANWQGFCADRLSGTVLEAGITLNNFDAELVTLRAEVPDKASLFEELEDFVLAKKQSLGLS